MRPAIRPLTAPASAPASPPPPLPVSCAGSSSCPTARRLAASGSPCPLREGAGPARPVVPPRSTAGSLVGARRASGRGRGRRAQLLERGAHRPVEAVVVDDVVLEVRQLLLELRREAAALLLAEDRQQRPG